MLFFGGGRGAGVVLVGLGRRGGGGGRLGGGRLGGGRLGQSGSLFAHGWASVRKTAAVLRRVERRGSDLGGQTSRWWCDRRCLRVSLFVLVPGGGPGRWLWSWSWLRLLPLLLGTTPVAVFLSTRFGAGVGHGGGVSEGAPGALRRRCQWQFGKGGGGSALQNASGQLTQFGGDKVLEEFSALDRGLVEGVASGHAFLIFLLFLPLYFFLGPKERGNTAFLWNRPPSTLPSSRQWPKTARRDVRLACCSVCT